MENYSAEMRRNSGFLARGAIVDEALKDENSAGKIIV